MPVITKFKITSEGKMTAGQFEETDVTSVQLGSDSVAKVSGLDETGDHVKFTSEGTIVASQFEEV